MTYEPPKCGAFQFLEEIVVHVTYELFQLPSAGLSGVLEIFHVHDICYVYHALLPTLGFAKACPNKVYAAD